MKHVLELILLVSAITDATWSIVLDDFTMGPVPSTDDSTLTSSPARSDVECAALCQSSSCSAMAFVPKTQQCLTSASRQASFNSASVDNAAVYRRNVIPYTNVVLVQVGSRNFRVIQQRFNGNVSFARKWIEYEYGFGDGTDFWIGLQAINMLTPSLLRVEVVTWANVMTISEYSGFIVGNSSTKYAMNFSSYIAVNASSDSLDYHRGAKFSTLDQDNDLAPYSCSQTRCGNGGWWYKSCAYSNPNGEYRTSAVIDDEKLMFWASAGPGIALKSIRLMLLV